MQTKTDEKIVVTSKVCWGNVKWRKAKKQQEKAGAKRKLNKTINRNIKVKERKKLIN
jgi:hypothetical protein